jgi:hypothetical protein
VLSPAPQYRCTNLARARRVAADAGAFAGIVSAEARNDAGLAPQAAGQADLRRRVLFLHLAQPVGPGTGGNILNQGGVLVTTHPATWAISADTLVNGNSTGVVPADEKARVVPLLAGLTAAALQHTLVVRTIATVDPVLNGIDFLEVIDAQLQLPDSPLRQRVLFVHLFLPVPDGLTGQFPPTVLIEGGSRITGINVDWAVSATQLANGDAAAIIPPPDIFLAEDQLIQLLPTGDADAMARILIVHTTAAGDFSPYELQIVADSEDSDGFNLPFDGFDSQLSRVTFSFKVDCPSDFDCLPDIACPPENVQAPLIDYLAKDYVSFRGLMLDRMAQTIPAWQERNPADLGVTIVELLAFAADQVSYFQDAVANEAYLGTARQRPSLRRHARLLDYTPREATNARTFVHIEVDTANASVEGQTLPQHTPLISRTEGLVPTNVTENDLEAAVRAGSQVFETMDPLKLHAAHNEIRFHTWGDDDCCLPKGATRATLLDAAAPGQTTPHLPIITDPTDAGAIKPGALLALVEVAGPDGQGAPPNILHRHVVRLTSVRRAVDALLDVPVIDIAWASDDALPFPLCLHTLDDGSPVSVVQGNIVLADHGHSVTEDLPPTTAVAGNQRYLPRLSLGTITFQAQVQVADGTIHPVDPTQPAVSALAGDPRLAVPDVTLFPIPANDLDHVRDCNRDLTTDTDHWTPVRDLLESGPFSQNFVVETLNDGTAQLRFGDDQLGAMPTEQLFACYRVGAGAAGNIGADGLVHIVAPFPGILTVSNPLPASGGQDAEPPQEIQLSAPQAFRVQERAVTEDDYADVAQRHPGVQRAVATRRFTGSWYTMFVAVDRLGGLPVDDAFKTDFAGFLERFRLAGYDLEIEGAIAVPLDLKLTVCVRPGFFRFDVKKALLDALSNRDLVGGARGFFHPDNFTFGQPVFLSQILAATLAVPGVAEIDTSATALTFKRLDRAVSATDPDGVLLMQRLEIAQLDNDPSQPEHGRLQLVMQGGS